MKAVEATGRKKTKVNRYITKFMKGHPLATFLIIFIGIPLLILLAVFAVVYLIELPLGFLMGWS